MCTHSLSSLRHFAFAKTTHFIWRYFTFFRRKIPCHNDPQLLALWWIAENSIKTYRTTGITSAILSLLHHLLIPILHDRNIERRVDLVCSAARKKSKQVSRYFIWVSFSFASFDANRLIALAANVAEMKEYRKMPSREYTRNEKQSSEEQLSSVATENIELFMRHETHSGERIQHTNGCM